MKVADASVCLSAQVIVFLCFAARLSRTSARFSSICWRSRCVRCQSFLSSVCFFGGVAPAAYSNLSRLGLILEDAEALLSWQQAAIGLSYYGLVVLKQWSLTNHPKYIYIFIFIKQEKAEGLWWRSMFKTWHSPLLQLAFWRHPILFDIFRVLQVYFFLLFPLLSWTLCSVACILSRFCIWMYPLFTRYKTHLHFPCSLLHMEPFKETISI